MKALTFEGKEKIEYKSVPDPEIKQSTDVIVKVKLCAICGSDLHVYHEHEKGIDSGTPMGHEFVGEVVDMGKEVKGLKKGDLVMSPFSTSCGNCFYCKIGLTSRCVQGQLFGWVEQGKGLGGGQSELVRVPLADSTLLKVPEGITQHEALLMGDILSTGFFCAYQAEVKANGVYVVVGCGPVGLMAILGCLEYGAEKVIAIDRMEDRLQQAERFGAIPLNPEKQNARDLIDSLTEGRGADAALEAVGSTRTLGLAYSLTRPGGIISAVGVCNEPEFGFSPVQAYNKSITLKIGRCPARNMMPQLTPVVQKKKYDLAQIFTHQFQLSEGVHGYDIFANRREKCLKVVLTPNS